MHPEMVREIEDVPGGVDMFEAAESTGTTTTAPFGRDFSDDDMAAQAAAFLAGKTASVEADPEPVQQTTSRFTLGQRVKESMTGVEGTVSEVDEDIATVKFDDGLGTSMIPIGELEPA